MTAPLTINMDEKTSGGANLPALSKLLHHETKATVSSIRTNIMCRLNGLPLPYLHISDSLPPPGLLIYRLSAIICKPRRLANLLHNNVTGTEYIRKNCSQLAGIGNKLVTVFAFLCFLPGICNQFDTMTTRQYC